MVEQDSKDVPYKKKIRPVPPHPDQEIWISGFREFTCLDIQIQINPWGSENFLYLSKPYMSPIFCYWHILIQPLLLGAPLIYIVLRNEVIQGGSEKNLFILNHI